MTEGKMDDFSGHTPGPWRVIHESDRAWGDNWSIVQAENALEDVAEMVVSAENARLIAAAPDLLAERDRLRAEVERLREALTWVRDEQGHCSECGAMASGPCGGMLACDCPSGKHWQHDPIHIARAALAQEPTP